MISIDCLGCQVFQSCELKNKGAMHEEKVQHCTQFQAPKVVKVKKKITGIWNSAYVQKLGIQDHCMEFLDLTDELRILKVYRDDAKIRAVSTGLANELMDMYIILDKWADGRDELQTERRVKFAAKELTNGEN